MSGRRMHGRGMGDIMPGCFAVPSNPFYSRTGPNCKGNVPVGRGGIVPGTPASVQAIVVASGLPATPAPATANVATGAVTVAAQGTTSPTTATTQTSPTITGTATAFGSSRGGYGDGVYRWSGGYAYQGTKGSYDDRWNGNASKIPVSPSSLLPTLPQVVTGYPNAEGNPACGGLTGWIASNPVLAAAALVGLYFAMKD